MENINELGTKEVRDIINSFKTTFNEIGLSMNTVESIHILAPSSIKILYEQFKDCTRLPDNIKDIVGGDIFVFELDAIQCIIEYGSLSKTPLGVLPNENSILMVFPQFKSKDDEMKFTEAASKANIDKDAPISDEEYTKKLADRGFLINLIDLAIRLFRMAGVGFIFIFLIVRLLTTEFIVPPYIVGILSVLIIISTKFFKSK